jgi:hypothetical protein
MKLRPSKGDNMITPRHFQLSPVALLAGILGVLVLRHVNNGTCTMRIPGVDRGIRYATDRTELEQARPPDRG